ncbi:hypothetical protein GCM10009664_69520 [Kitasatospora gansuensis]
MIDARKRARELSAGIAERHQRLLDRAERFLLAQEKTDQQVRAINARIKDLHAEVEEVRLAGQADLARVAAEMAELGCSRKEIAERLGVDPAEVRRLLAAVRRNDPVRTSAGRVSRLQSVEPEEASTERPQPVTLFDTTGD